MKDVIISILTSQPFWTIISGVIVFAISQYLMEVWIKPLQDYIIIKKEKSYSRNVKRMESPW